MQRLLLLILLLCTHAFAVASDVPAYDKRLSRFTYPFPVKTFTVSSQGMNLAMTYMYLQPKDDKPVVTLLHGKNFNGAYWHQTATFLQQQGFGVLIPDQIGFGKSAKPVSYQYSFAALASNTRTLLQALNIDNTIVVGHSMGGMLASRFALLYPELTCRLVLVNPIGLENYLLYERYVDVEKRYQNELKKTPDMIVSYQRKNYYDGHWNSNFSQHARFLQGWIAGKDWPQLARVSALTYDMIFTQPVIDDFRYFEMPVTILLGTRDRTAPGKANLRDGVDRELGRYDRLGAEIKQHNAAIDVIELSGLGHLPHIEDFSRFAPAFLRALSKDK